MPSSEGGGRGGERAVAVGRGSDEENSMISMSAPLLLRPPCSTSTSLLLPTEHHPSSNLCSLHHRRKYSSTDIGGDTNNDDDEDGSGVKIINKTTSIPCSVSVSSSQPRPQPPPRLSGPRTTMMMSTIFFCVLCIAVVVVVVVSTSSSSFSSRHLGTDRNNNKSNSNNNIPSLLNRKIDPDGFLSQILPLSAFPKTMYDNIYQHPQNDPNVYRCQPRKIHLSQKSDVSVVVVAADDADAADPADAAGADGVDQQLQQQQVVNMTVSFTVDKEYCGSDNITTVIVYGKQKQQEQQQQKKQQQRSGGLRGIIDSFFEKYKFWTKEDPQRMVVVSSNNRPTTTSKGGDDDDDDKPDPFSEVVQFTYNSPVTGPSYQSDYIHHVTIPNLQPGSRYWYRIITVVVVVDEKDDFMNTLESSSSKFPFFTVPDFISRYIHETSSSSSSSLSLFSLRGSYQVVGQTNVYTFPTPPRVKSTNEQNHQDADDVTTPASETTLALVGDLGQTENSTKTMFNIMNSDATSLIIAGDLSYADGDPYRWESWLELMEPLLRSLPMSSIPGNHEIECDDVSHQVFIPYESYFRNPNRLPRKPDRQPPSDEYRKTLWHGSCTGPSEFLGHYNYGNAFTSYRHGLAHIIMLNSYTSVNASSIQYDWLKNTALPSVDREITPWLLVIFHVPIYTTFLGHNGEINSVNMKESIEDLLFDKNVNIVVSGHDHAYSRSKKMYRSEPHPNGPVYLTLGAGGNREQHTGGYIHEHPESWIAKRENDEYGFGLLTIPNKTHAHLSWRRDHTCSSGDECVRDNVWIKNTVR